MKRWRGNTPEQRMLPSVEDPYSGLAARLRENVAARLADIRETDLDRVFDTILGEMETEMVDIEVKKLITAMQPAEKLALYERALGSDRISDASRRLAEVQAALLERQARMAELKKDFIISRMVNLERIEPGEVLEFGMFYSGRDGSADKKNSASHIITARVQEQPGAWMLKINEKVASLNTQHMLGSEPYGPVLSTNELFQIGTPIQTGENVKLEPFVTYDMEPTIRWTDDHSETIPRHLGYVLLGNEVILDRPVV